MELYGLMEPEQINILNPLGLFILIPTFDTLIYPALERRGIDISPLRRMGWGMIVASFAFFLRYGRFRRKSRGCPSFS